MCLFVHTELSDFTMVDVNSPTFLEMETEVEQMIFEGIKKGIVELRNKKGWPFARVNWDDITRIEDFQAVITFLLHPANS